MVAAKTASLWDRFAPADPGLLRLAAGLRAVLGLTLALAALAVLDQPSAVLLAGGFTAVVTSLAISDLHPRNQFRTLLAGAPVTLAALTTGGLLASLSLASHLAFLLLIFAAVYARRFGRRGLDLGIFAFMAYFLSQFAGIHPHQLPQLAGALAVSFTTAAVARFCLVPATSYGILTRLRAAFDRRLRDTQQAMSELRTDSAGSARRLERRLQRLHTSAQLIQEFLYEAPTAHLRDTTVELERTAREDAKAQRLGVRAIRASKDPAAPSVNAVTKPETVDQTNPVERDHIMLRPTATQPAGPSRYTTRQACQVTAAAAIAMFVGHVVSPHQWYWAVATAWVVFINAAHTGDILLQSGRRLIGTVAGVPFGYGLAVVAAGHTSLALGFLLACVFGMFYTPPGSYWAVTFFITGSLSMVLALLHTLSPELLSLRIQETALGAGCGILAALLVVPTTVRTVADEHLRELLAILDHLMCCTPPQTEAMRPTPAARDLDQALEAFRKACRPLVHPLNPRRAELARTRCLLEHVETAAFHARSLATETGYIPAGRGGARNIDRDHQHIRQLR
ncbi:FUSC family protein [Streptomyces sp. HC44]|uniref:FUSC family protein n=1 Tax=Streptomyces scabichelini TaxID=2711217 RepID=A0A6G4V8X3_9ACTN|nr:FUSC family protein [Streptomyces scabichelini]NGO10562.1 FUSC family protein [Streptomyces scabichelini]